MSTEGSLHTVLLTRGTPQYRLVGGLCKQSVPFRDLRETLLAGWDASAWTSARWRDLLEHRFGTRRGE